MPRTADGTSPAGRCRPGYAVRAAANASLPPAGASVVKRQLVDQSLAPTLSNALTRQKHLVDSHSPSGSTAVVRPWIAWTPTAWAKVSSTATWTTVWPAERPVMREIRAGHVTFGKDTERCCATLYRPHRWCVGRDGPPLQSAL